MTSKRRPNGLMTGQMTQSEIRIHHSHLPRAHDARAVPLRRREARRADGGEAPRLRLDRLRVDAARALQTRLGLERCLCAAGRTLRDAGELGLQQLDVDVQLLHRDLELLDDRRVRLRRQRLAGVVVAGLERVELGLQAAVPQNTRRSK